MRIALDSSVLIAAHISRAGVFAELLEDLLSHHELVTSEFILEELVRKLVGKFSFPKREAAQVAAFLRRVALVVVPADLPVLGTAAGGQCKLLISVDRDLLDMTNIAKIPILRPGEYWRRTREIK